MKELTFNVPPNFNLFLAGDLHVGSRLFDQEAFEAFSTVFSGEYCGVHENYLVLHGDTIEAINIDDPRFDRKIHGKTLLEQTDHAIKLLRPFRHRLLTILAGNHEWRLRRIDDFARYIASSLDVPYGTMLTKITYKWRRRKLFKHLATHGRKPLNSTAKDPVQRHLNKKLALKWQLAPLAHDCLLMSCGHAHQVITLRPAIEGARGQYIAPEQRWYACSGSFTRPYIEDQISYIEAHLLEPHRAGFVVVLIRDAHIADIHEHRL